MFQFSAPYPMLTTTTILPSPQFSDQESLLDSVARKLALDGTKYTYVKRRNKRRKMRWIFRLSRNKALEFRAFIYAYFASKIKVIDHNDRVWVGNFINNPFEFDTPDTAQPAIAPMPRGELQAIEIDFEGVEQL
jgi:ribosomal protein L20